ncbi:ferric reductase-like transmembrane domain-containing protein [Paenibacillus sp. LHD-117]|uniref:ferric reductase-like transmembrane domain-containing protein n=1 Tax=Paenibacillus sp. LHD-117 TaxID=3071412 RepID=UPI0035A938A2
MILMALTLLLATRMRLLERLVGGLDRMYEVHKHAGVIIFFLLLHLIVMPFGKGQFLASRDAREGLPRFYARRRFTS